MGGDTDQRPAILGPLQTTPAAQLTGRRRAGERDGRSPRPSSPSEIKKRTERSLEESNQRLKSIEVRDSWGRVDQSHTPPPHTGPYVATQTRGERPKESRE